MDCSRKLGKILKPFNLIFLLLEKNLKKIMVTEGGKRLV